MTVMSMIEIMAAEIKEMDTISVKQAPLTSCEHV